MSALTPEQLVERRKGIGSSEARIIAAGTDEERHQLWMEKTGRAQPRAILSPWDAALRHHCEPLILDWYELTTQHLVTRRGEMVVSQRYPMLRCILDGFDAAIPKVIDAKMLNVWTPDPQQWVLDTYTWQIFHQILVTAVDKGALHVSLGMREPYPVEIEYQEFEALQYVDAAETFWSYVTQDKEPPGAPVIAPPIPIETMRVVDMMSNNVWGNYAALWRGNRLAAEQFAGAAKELKGLVEKDVRHAYGHGIEIRRDKRGLSIKELKS